MVHVSIPFHLTLLQLYKYATKLKLLEHGLLSAVHDISEPSESIRDEAGDEGPKAGAEMETFEEYKERMDDLVQKSLRSASSSTRDNYKDGLVYQARKDVILEFLKAAIQKKCSNCGA
jgi:hypothetical protein